MPPTPASQQDELLKATLEMLVLKSLTVQPMHGYAIVQHIARLSNGVFTVDHGSLYPALARLQKNGWIVGKWGESSGSSCCCKARATTRSPREDDADLA